MTAGPADAAGVLRLALARPPRLGRTHLVCVDGPAGSGKTTFAARLVDAARLEGRTADTVHMDDVFEGWGGLVGAGRRVLTQVVQPLASGQSAAYERYDWDQGRYAGTVTVPPVDVLVVEGVGSGDPSYADRVALLVWVQAPAPERLARGLARDGTALEEQWRRWMREEAALHTRDRTAQRADVLVDGVSGSISSGRSGDA